MTYLLFHLLFTFPALLLAFWLVRKRLISDHIRVMGVVALIAFVATVPWDNWAVHHGIWDFDWQRVTPVELVALNKTWRLPLEEYAFFVLLPLFVTLLSTRFLPRQRQGMKEERYHYN